MVSLRWRTLTAKAALVVTATVTGLSLPDGRALAAPTRPQDVAPIPPKPTGLVIDIPGLTLYHFVNGELVRSFPITAGKPATPTPTGSYKIIVMAKDPWWQPPWGGPVVPPGPDNALSTRWMEWYDGNGIHGTPWPDSIGYFASYGCIRMLTQDAEWLYDQVKIGTPVTVKYEPVELLYGNDGRRYLAYYPDPYGKGSRPTRDLLLEAGVDPNSISIKGHGLYPLEDLKAFVHGKAIASIMHGGQPYIPARILAREMNATVKWDAAAHMVSLDGHPVPTILRGNTGFVAAFSAAQALGAEYAWNSAEETVFLKGRTIFVNNHLIARKGQNFEGELYLPLRVVAEATGAHVGWDGAKRMALLNGQPILSRLHEGSSYTPASILAERLGLRLRMVGEAVHLDH